MQRDEEEWHPLPVAEFADRYSVSSHGRIRSEARVNIDRRGWPRRWPELILKCAPSSTTGYPRFLACDASRSGRRSWFNVHRMVAIAFLGPGPEGTEVCHIDGTRTNNYVGNLYWGTHSENLKDVVRLGKFRNQHTHAARCPRNHLYCPQNHDPYVIGYRACMACRLATREKARKKNSLWTEAEVQKAADRHYAFLMSAPSAVS